MDNSNNPNSPNNPAAPVTPADTTPPPTPDLTPPPQPAQPEQAWSPPQDTITPDASTWPPSPQTSTPSEPPTMDTGSQFPSSWSQPTPTPAPKPPQPSTPPQDTSSLAAPIPSPPIQPNQTWPQDTAPTSSPLDNPWGAPIQPPPISGPESVPIESDSIPTDLSHLITADTTNTPSTDVSQPSILTSETLVVPPASTPEVPTIPTNNGGIPKWVIGLGVGLLIIVAGASAYFILGIGQPPKTTSVPTQTAPATRQTSTPSPVAQPSPQSAATGSASFGELEGGSGSQQATSAADLLRQRQQQGR